MVENQPPAFGDRDLWSDDVALREAIASEGAADFSNELGSYGALAGGDLYKLGFDANRDRPRLRTHNAQGQRIDTVEFHPAYHQLMYSAKRHGVGGLSYESTHPAAHVARAGLSYLHHQAEAGTSCPLTMTHAAIGVLRQQPMLAEWAAKAAAPFYDSRDVHISDKKGITIGMGMTEKQGGSDVRTNATMATPLSNPGEYALVGHKWFFSAPMSDGWLVLAQAPNGLTCFLVPRRLSTGAKNNFRIMRLKDKLGDWSNASSEIEFTGTMSYRVGAEGRGVATIIEMVALTRLDCMLGAAAEMRMALAQAVHYTAHRRTFGKTLSSHPLMANVLADLAVESEAATRFAIRVAGAVAASPRDPHSAAFARVATAIGKYWVCKRAAVFVNEAQECLGGAGYVEESMLPRLYRQAPLNSIWEGSGNIQCLDVLRALGKDPAVATALRDELQLGCGKNATYDAAVAEAMRSLSAATVSEGGARRLVEDLALLLQGGVLLRAGSPVADLFVESRISRNHGLAFGTLPTTSGTVSFADIIQRALPL